MSVEYFSKKYEGLSDYEQKCYPSSSNVQVFKYCDNPPSYEIRASFEDVKGLIEKLGAPQHFNRVYCLRICSGAMFIDKSDKSFKRFKNYTVEQFGLVIEPELQKRGGVDAGYTSLKESDYLCLPLYWNERPDYRVQVWRSRVFACPITAIQTSPSKPLVSNLPLIMCLEERWHPYRGKRRSLTWLEHRYRSSETFEEFRRDALSILGDGRRRRRQKLYDDPDEFYRQLLIAYKKAAKGGNKDPSQPDVAFEMKPSISIRTLQYRLKEHGISWPPQR